MEYSRNILTTPPRWKEIWCALALFFIIVILCFGSQASTNLDITIKVILVAKFGIDVLGAGVHYTITRERLIVKCLNIPLRTIRWKNISHAAYLHDWHDMISFSKWHIAGTVYGHIIFLTLNGCPKYHPERQNRHWYSVRHPFRTVCIWLPEETRYEYIDFFKACYPELEMQPVRAED